MAVPDSTVINVFGTKDDERLENHHAGATAPSVSLLVPAPVSPSVPRRFPLLVSPYVPAPVSPSVPRRFPLLVSPYVPVPVSP
jgi:hypothetical protein